MRPQLDIGNPEVKWKQSALITTSSSTVVFSGKVDCRECHVYELVYLVFAFIDVVIKLSSTTVSATRCRVGDGEAGTIPPTRLHFDEIHGVMRLSSTEQDAGKHVQHQVNGTPDNGSICVQQVLTDLGGYLVHGIDDGCTGLVLQQTSGDSCQESRHTSEKHLVDMHGFLKNKAAHPNLPPEIWLHIFQFATYVPDILAPEIYDHFSTIGWLFNRDHHRAIRDSLMTKRYLVRVCKMWYILASPYLYSTLINPARGTHPFSGEWPLGSWTERLDIAMRDQSPTHGDLESIPDEKHSIDEWLLDGNQLNLYYMWSAESHANCLHLPRNHQSGVLYITGIPTARSGRHIALTRA
ncbi:hypothetical protein BV22DRAFT_1122340 [Leucogyrophana mollusca]|uniref:Uncharacterized protein n=1 Tax=Leucogyrophana mollusca TaxID=85980 RepID=A0ACB8B662_9AGAM|nr:hypothetical protein BV22DRAFT_1122340 [Leucogyrophana mollusca]